MKGKANRLEMIKMLISSREMCCQEEILHALQQVGYDITQATLSRDLKQLKVAKAASINGKYIFVLPNDTLYKRVDKPLPCNRTCYVYGLFYLFVFQAIWLLSKPDQAMQAV